MSASLQAEPWAGEAPPARVTLRAGGKPLRFQGEMLAEGSSRREHATAWHEVAVYRCEDGGFAAALRLRGQAGILTDTDRAQRFPDLDTLAGWLEHFDPAGDLKAGFDVADPDMSGAELAVKAASLRDRSDDLRRAYRALIGELLFRLETEL